MCTFKLVILATMLGGAAHGEAATVEQVRATIGRSIPYIEEKGAWWIEEKKCVSCHRVGTMVWSLAAASEQGFSVSDRLKEWFTWAVETSLAKNDQGTTIGAGNKEGVAQLLFARRLIDHGSDRASSDIALRSIIAQGLLSDGSWKPGGQLPSQKRPKSETTDVTTMWLASALADRSLRSDVSAVLDTAVKHLEASPPGKSTEWYVARLLIAHRLGDNTTASATVEALRGQQQPDGGWGWIVGEESDALGTGMSVYALLRAGVDSSDVVIKHAQQFLIGTQRDDGSWAVKGTKANKKGRIEETASYWGTTWAVIALVESLPN